MQAQLATSDIMEAFRAKGKDPDWSFTEYKPSDTGKWSHSYHRYPAKFIPQLVERLIDEYVSTEDAHINDPFYGCGTTIASGSMVTEMVKGKSVSDARKISQQDVLNALGGLPEESQHCALLAANTLKEAVKDYLAFRDEPWKRAYKGR